MNISYSYKNNVRLYALIKKPLKVFTYSLISLCSFVSKNIHENNKTVKHMHHSITVQNLIFQILGQKTGKLEIQYQFWIWTPFFSPQWCHFLWTIYLSSEINFLIIIYLIRISLSVHLIYFWSFKTSQYSCEHWFEVQQRWQTRLLFHTSIPKLCLVIFRMLNYICLLSQVYCASYTVSPYDVATSSTVHAIKSLQQTEYITSSVNLLKP